jgi:hypothetical protein
MMQEEVGMGMARTFHSWREDGCRVKEAIRRHTRDMDMDMDMDRDW